jgi:hypothetical protein
MHPIEQLRSQARFLITLGEQGHQALDHLIRLAVEKNFPTLKVIDFSDCEVVLQPLEGISEASPKDCYTVDYYATADGTIQFRDNPVKTNRVMLYDLEESTKPLTSKLMRVYSEIANIKRVKQISEYGVMGMKLGNRKGDSTDVEGSRWRTTIGQNNRQQDAEKKAVPKERSGKQVLAHIFNSKGTASQRFKDKEAAKHGIRPLGNLKGKELAAWKKLKSTSSERTGKIQTVKKYGVFNQSLAKAMSGFSSHRKVW